MWILILTLYAGALSSGDSVSLISIPNFTSEASCVAAGNKAAKFETMHKSTNFVCVRS